MTLTEAESKARRSLYDHEVNAALLDHKQDIAQSIRSLKTQTYEDRGGKVSGRYTGAVPEWFLHMESAETAVFELHSVVFTVRGLLKFIQEHEPELFGLYALKYRDAATLPELRRRFGAKVGRLDRELVFRLIEWHDWRMTDADEFLAWRKRRRGF